ncbi:MAG: hypothetical protein ACTHJ0_02485 [Flavipsychrobacter sp.]
MIIFVTIQQYNQVANNNNSIEFFERQRFRLWWAWIILIVIIGTFIWGIIQQTVFHIPFGSKPVSSLVLLCLTVIPVGIALLIFSIVMKTKITMQGIYCSFRPFELKGRMTGWDDVDRVYVREYSAMKEFMGWGLKYGGKMYGWAYTVGGKYGVQLQLKGGKKILLGTHKPEEVKHLLCLLKEKGILTEQQTIPASVV